MMDSDCLRSNLTDSCEAPRSAAGLAVGLTLFFLSVVIIAALVLYKFQRKIRTVFAQKRAERPESPAVEAQPHTPHTPIYENLTGGYKQAPLKPARSMDRSEEDLYLQCDPVQDDIYMNGPGCQISVSHEDDVYVMPDANSEG